MDVLTPATLCAVMLGVGALAFVIGRRIGRKPTPVDRYAIDFGSMGRKKARAGRVAYDKDWVCTIYETDFLYLDRYPHRHIMDVTVDMSAVTFSMGILLTAPESAKVEAGDDWAYFDGLAQQVRDNPFRFRNTPIERSS